MKGKVIVTLTREQHARLMIYLMEIVEIYTEHSDGSPVDLAGVELAVELHAACDVERDVIES
jgi:hypothetical protein